MTPKQECKDAYDNFKREKNFSKEVKNCVWDIDILLPEPPKDYRTIANYGLPKSERKFPYLDQDFIKEIDALPLNHPKRKEHLDEMWDRRRNGFWFYNGDNLEWVTGYYYMTLQYWLIPIEDKDGGLGNPKFVDLHRDITYAIWWCKLDPDTTGLVYLGTRRSGKSILGLAEGYWDTTEKYNALFGLQSKTDADSKILLGKLVKSWQKLPSFLKPVDTGYNTVSRELKFDVPQKKDTKGNKKEYKEVLNSRIVAYASTEAAMDGERTTFQFQDECFNPETEIMMSNGTPKRIKDISVGEYVMGADGLPSKVVDTYEGVDQMYKVDSKKFQSYECNSAHKITCYWAIRDTETKIFGKKYRYGEPIDITPEQYLSLSAHKRKHLMLKKGVSDFDNESPRIDPYIFGMWLGDGLSNLSTFTITTADQEVKDYLQLHANNIGAQVTRTIRGNGLENVRIINNKERQVFVAYGLNKNKHIPEAFLNTSREYRLNILAGLVDSDGFYGRSFEIVQKRKNLAHDIYRLSLSLGFHTTISEKIATMRREDGTIYRCKVYRVCIYGELHTVPTKIKRKQAVTSEHKNRRTPNRAWFDVEKIGVGEYKGIKLDRSPYMMLKDGTIVHNCGKRQSTDAYLTQKITKICCVVGRKVVGFAFWATTVEEMEKGGGEAAKKIWDASNPAKRNANNRTSSTMLRLFFPAEYGLLEGGFIDDWGYSLIEEAAKWLDAEEEDKQGEDLLDHKRKFPRNVEDCFAIKGSSNSYNQRKLYEQYRHAGQLSPLDRPVRGNFQWKDGMKDTEVVFYPDEDNGKWLVAWMPPEEDRNRKEKIGLHWTPTRDFCKTGADPFAHRQTTEKGSMGAAHTILESHYKFPKMKMAWVCQYLARPEHPHEQAEDMIMQCVFYSSYFLCEKNVYGVLDNFHKRGYDGYCMFNPLDPESTKKRLNGHRGMPMTGTDAGEALSSITQAHIADYIGFNHETKSFGFCPFLELISDWQKFDPNNRTEFDCAMSGGMALIATKKVKQKEEFIYSANQWLPRYNNRGNISERILK